ncbi:MAG: trypsin-like peptidase domain-containing protein [Candidatus Hydrogenedentes bacterium]|nr:trypsin-like peptidase domain-containing protein [Candidatus Hydrogenedentota bacterium]
MRNLLVLLMLVLAGATASWAQPHADYATAPALATKAAQDASLHPLPQTLVESYLTRIDQSHVFNEYEGKNGELKTLAEDHKQYLVGSGFPVGMDSQALFGEGFSDGSMTVYEAAISSVDAEMLRFLVDLSELGEGEEAWVIDMSEPRAFGPYTSADAREGGRWLPTTVGESAVLMVRTTGTAVPQIALLGVSHFFQRFEEVVKALACNNNIACEGNATLQSLSSGIGMMVIPYDTYDQALCTGSLVNNSDTAELEPYFLTSWHCVPDYADADEVDIVWDYRATGCATNDPPSVASLPRSVGEVVLTTNSSYDLTLMRLISVPSGSFGRTYLGWETRDPILNEDIVTIHYPGGTHMRISYGTVIGIDEARSSFIKQTNVHWDDGVTEGGSSGSPLLLADSNYRITGTLSNGPTHSCSDISGNVDWYTSFRDFYSQADGWLTGTNPPDPDGGGDVVLCAAAKAFKDNEEILKNLRAFRDEGLMKTEWGQPLVEIYYAAAPYLVDLLDWSPKASGVFRMAARPFAYLGSVLSHDV